MTRRCAARSSTGKAASDFEMVIMRARMWPRAAAWSSDSAEAGNVARHLVDLQMHLIARLPLAPARDGERMRDQQAVEAAPFDMVDRQRRAVERHRALDGDEPRQFLRRLEQETAGRTEILPLQD